MDRRSLKEFVHRNAAAKVPPDNPACPPNGRFGVSIARHGITGTPPLLIGRFIDAVPAGTAKGIEDAAYREAVSPLCAFRAEGTARIVADTLTASV